jgi:hypothetical protein
MKPNRAWSRRGWRLLFIPGSLAAQLRRSVTKILNIPQSGKRGTTVSQGGRFGQISRALVIPTNPRTADQMLVRNHLSGIAAQWRGLTQEQRNAWTEAAKQVNSASRLGKSGALTGSQPEHERLGGQPAPVPGHRGGQHQRDQSPLYGLAGGDCFFLPCFLPFLPSSGAG